MRFGLLPRRLSTGELRRIWAAVCTKKRLPRPGKGKSGGYRTLVGYRKGNSDRVVFLYGFPKSKRSNITDKEKAALSLAAESFINATDEQVARLIKDRNMFELEASDE